MKTGRQKLFLCAAGLAALIVFCFAEEHFRGKWTLAALKKRMSAQGEKFTVEESELPRPAAADDGFAELMAACARLPGALVIQAAPASLQFTAPGKVIVTRTLAEWKPMGYRRDEARIDWRVLQETLPGYAEPFADARAALRKPVLDAHPRYRLGFDIPLPHLTRFRELAQQLGAVTALALHRGRLDEALENLEALVALTRALKDERLIISQLVRQGIANMAFSVTWQALQSPGWSDAQLLRLQHAWQSLEFVRPIAHALEMERAIGSLCFGTARASADAVGHSLGLWQSPPPGQTNFITSMDELVQYLGDNQDEIMGRNLIIPFWQVAWSHQDERNYLEEIQTLIDHARAAAQERSGRAALALEQQLEQRTTELSVLRRLRFFMSYVLLPTLERTVTKALVTETQKELVVGAIALQRYELRHRRPAPELPALVPEFLAAPPHDFLAGEPLRYRRTDDGGFLLYSIGKNARDDGGDAQPLEPGTRNFFLLNGRDLVWPRPATAEEVAKFNAAEAKRR